jgi:murein DD-endopeptidase MepM/ murein hydrolase activator NlpD
VNGERLRLLVLRDLTGESWQIAIPLRLFQFLLGSLVILVILAGVAITWLGVIAVRLQAAEVIASENIQLRGQLTRVSQLQEEVNRMAEREKSLMALTQSFLDDPETGSVQTTTQSSGLFDEASRKAFLTDIRTDRSKSEFLHQTHQDKFHPINLSPLLSDWRLIPQSIQAGTTNTTMDERVFFTPSGEPVSSPDEGVVGSAGWDPSMGLSVKLLLANGVECFVGDLGQLEVQPGDIVHRGQTFAKTTPPGGETSSHVRVRISVNGLAIDPLIAMIR